MIFPHVRYRNLRAISRIMHNVTGLKYINQVLKIILGLQYKWGWLLYKKYNCTDNRGANRHKGAKLVTHVGKETFHKLSKSVGIIIGFSILGVSLSGCGAGDTLNNLGLAVTGGSTTEQQVTQNNATAPTKPPITFAQVFGPPVNVAQKLSGALENEAQVRSIKVIKDKSAKTGYTVRGYLSASPEKNGTKLSYIWDVTNPAGKRAHRIKGEEIVAGRKNEKDPWSAIDQSAIQVIASKTATRLANWLPANKSSNLLQNASLQSPSKAGKYSGPVIALVPAVKGAPGDGSQSLASALKKQLQRQNIKLASGDPSQVTFKVLGIVNLSAPKKGQQDINIQWVIRDPNNKRLGTVSQKNKIPSGSLDGAWGKTADAAASAAAEGIIKLLKN